MMAATEIARLRIANRNGERMRIPLLIGREGECGFWTIERIKD